ncbi:MAG: hypothetical protein FWF12_01855 [Betaproteobacteria bacterium]|nr:hypothetical protein [Betaproteobacteria bacterium]
MNVIDEFSRAIISPLVEQHITDAAFYWKRRDLFAHSPILNWQAQLLFDNALEAHLEGVRVAGKAGWELAIEVLDDWKRDGELFVCATLGLERGYEKQLDPVWSMLQDKPATYLRALIGAALWQTQERKLELVKKWGHSDDELCQVAAWRVLARGDGFFEDSDKSLSSQLTLALEHPSAFVRAAACRASFRLRQTERVTDLLKDSETTVAAEAAIALLRTGDLKGLPLLHKAVSEFGSSEGLRVDPLTQAPSRIERWIRYLGIASPPGSEEIEDLLDFLPSRQVLLLILHHGDPAWLPRVRQYLNVPSCARYAGWVWSSLTGINIENSPLELFDEDRDDDDEVLDENEWKTDDIDLGLPMPNAKAVVGAEPPLPVGKQVLLGHPVNELDLRALLRESPHDLRWLAAAHLERHKKGAEIIDVRSPARR